MYKIWNSFQSKLTWYLIGCVVLSGILSVGCAYLLINIGLTVLQSGYGDIEFNRRLQAEYIKSLQEYVDENEVTAETISQIRKWTDDNSYVYLAVYQNNRVIFNSDYYYDDTGTENGGTDEEFEILDDDYEILDVENIYQLGLADETVASVDIFCYDYWRYYYYIWIAGVLFGILLFVYLTTRMVQRKIRYINEIEADLQILEGGNLEYPVTVKGNDELSSLAEGIDQMRLSIIDNIKKERLMVQANKDLVTSMSHDLRTPLTTLTGYLEILNMNDRINEEQRERYLKLSLAKTREIKELSDELFEYFLIYGEDRKRLAVEKVPAYMLAEDLAGNQFFYLEEEGYQIVFTNHLSEEDGNCLINVKYMQRVLNNILSNLEKYADKEKPIEIDTAKEQHYMVIRVKNGIRKNIDSHESTKIGLITCERIMKLHHGEFQKFEVEGEFTVRLTIPME